MIRKPVALRSPGPGVDGSRPTTESESRTGTEPCWSSDRACRRSEDRQAARRRTEIRPLQPNTRSWISAAVAPHRLHQSRAHDHVGGRRQLLKAEPPDVVVFLGSDVRRRSLPVTHQPSTKECGLFCRSCAHPTQMRRRARCYLHAEFFVQFPRQRAQFGLAKLNDSTRQVPHVRVGTLLRTPVYEEDATFTNQRADNDLVHSRIKAWTSDKRTSAHAATPAVHGGAAHPSIGRTPSG